MLGDVILAFPYMILLNLVNTLIVFYFGEAFDTIINLDERSILYCLFHDFSEALDSIVDFTDTYLIMLISWIQFTTSSRKYLTRSRYVSMQIY